MSDKVPSAREVLALFMEDPACHDVVGEREGKEAASEAEHFYLCPACQQPVDMRDLAAVFHHEEAAHEPLPVEDAKRLVRITEQLRRATKTGP